jgi:hypothetical protein
LADYGRSGVLATSRARIGDADARTVPIVIALPSTVGLGVIHLKDGVYGQGQYDAILPNRQETNLYFGWAETAGWYTGPGFCTS